VIIVFVSVVDLAARTALVFIWLFILKIELLNSERDGGKGI
jgi:hypothetical protein